MTLYFAKFADSTKTIAGGTVILQLKKQGKAGENFELVNL